MNILQLVFIYLFTQNVFGAELYESQSWKNLLHLDETENEVISPQWYLSSEKTAKSEYDFFLKELNSHEQPSIACEFPARYLYLQGALNLKNLGNLETCSDLDQFYKSFNKKNISIAITSEYYNAPSSAFGHIMLLFHDQRPPELDSRVVHFSALTKNDDFLHYSMNGLTGNYSGYFFQEPFFKKYNEYSNIEQRYIFVHPLKMNENQRKILIYHLYELKKARFKYYFLAKNCGHQINKLVQITFNKNEKSPSIYFLPSEVLHANAEFLEPAIVLSPLSTRAKSSIQSLNPEAQMNFERIIDDEENKPQIDNNLSNELKTALVLYTQYQFRKKKHVLANYNQIQSLSVSNLDQTTEGNKRIDSPLLKQRSKKISIRPTNNNNSKSNSLFLGIRPVLIDLNDFQNHNLHESNFNLLSPELRLRDSKVRLEKFDLINLKLVSIFEKYFVDPSWFLNSGLNRDNNRENLSFSNSFGVGHSFDYNITFSYFLGAAFELTEFKKFDSALLSYFNTFFYLNEDYKFLYDGKLKFYKNQFFYNHNFSIRKSFKEFNLSLGYIYAKETKEYLGLDYYF